MSNQSTRTRQQQVYDLLNQRRDQWVDGTELANERVGGSEGLRRLRELSAGGHPIARRKHPDKDRDIWQYRLLPLNHQRPMLIWPSMEKQTWFVDPEKSQRTTPPGCVIIAWTGHQRDDCPECHQKGQPVRGSTVLREHHGSADSVQQRLGF